MERFAEDNPKWCSYCKNSIEEGEAHVVVDSDAYHLFCYKQMNTGIDEFGDEVGYKDE